MNRHSNNFDFLRLVFAFFVIITHSFNLIDLTQKDWLAQLTNGQLTFSHLGVCGFFAISGYLIIKSLQRSPSIGVYMKKRVLRLFPALFVVLVLTVIYGAFITDVSAQIYFSNYKTYLYVPANMSLFRLQDFLPGVFTSNPFSGAINGSLWTLPYEFACYLMLILLFFVQDIKKLKIIVGAAVALLFIAKLFFFAPIKDFDFVLAGEYMLEFGGYFAMGSLLAVFNIKAIQKKGLLSLFSLVAIVLLTAVNQLHIFSFIMLPLFIISLGLMNTPGISNVSKYLGDLSYGIYIYAFPVQQSLIYFGVKEPVSLMILAAIITPFFAYASWHLVEKRFLKMKKSAIKVE